MFYKKKYDIKSSKIVINKKAYHNYFIEETFQSGLILEGWEVKSIRSGRINISESYITNTFNELYLYNCLIQALPMSSNHIFCNPIRKRKLLLHKNEINFLSMKIKNIGYTLIPLSLFWKKSWCKLELGLAKGKTLYDKRLDSKKKEWNKEKFKILKKN
ncbi:SsrA-binding protein SmpB [Buchnera aphidicola]|uniref:SsrA-binding protein n=1 Tax=Buchnera aphidicola (Artemisaphis artemisicola) TaxID=1241836 RepID=A0A4D6XKU2_9GAMM|nr:SsrA-binding protein SmpB [Buchnera aphidicola]QCI15934.1 SsrA-binding protein SmpB [Buchnera aphidicola (Artemisaphis artemisicola)]